MNQHQKKILVIRFSSIGDIVLTSPAIRCLRQQTGAQVHFLTKQAFLPLLEESPWIDKIFTIQRSLGEVLPALKKENYDCLLDLHVNLRSLRVRLALRCKTYAFHKLNLEKWLLVQLKINRLPDKHVVDRYLAAAAPLGVRNDGKGLEYFLPEAMPLPAQIPPGPYIAFAIGAAHGTKRLPREKIAAICSGIKCPVVLLGGAKEQQDGAFAAATAGPHVSNCCGQLNLHESAIVLRNAWKVIAHDTGMMHIAAAFKKEILSIWGSTVPALGMYPYFGKDSDNRSKIFEVNGLPCRPCSKIGFEKCPQGHFRCMRDIRDADIIRHANQPEA
ncbi:MAG: hypothetical protein RI973_225 [Bacteroidota bacterium]